MDPQGRTVDRLIARIAGRAHGVVAVVELLAAGISRDEIRGRVRRGALIREYRGVYRVGHAAPSTEAGYMAAVKACGEGAVLSGLAAAHLLKLIKRRPTLPEVTTLTERRVKGIRTTRSRQVQRMTFDRIPVTTIARTLVDIAARLTEGDLAHACHEAQVRYRTTPAEVEALLRRRPTSPGAAKLRRAIAGDTHVSLSALACQYGRSPSLERKFLQLLREANLPLPDESNKYAGSHRVDFRWLKQKLTVELDSYRFHNTRHAFEQDRKRERDAYARGDHFRRYTYGDVFEHPAQMLAELRALLAARDPAPAPAAPAT